MIDINPGINDGYPYPQDGTIYDEQLYFSASDGVDGFELWSTDGTAGGTQRVKDIYTGAGGSYPAHLIVNNNLLYFTAFDSAHGNELWVTDGTSGGTQLVKDIRTGTAGGVSAYMTIHNDRLFFAANDGINGLELWSSDGIASGTEMVEDLLPGSDNSNPLHLAVYNSKLYFVARHSYTDGYQVFQYDDETGMVQQIVPPSFLGDACVDNDVDAFSVLSITLGMMIYPAFYDSAGMELYRLNTSTGISEAEINFSFLLFPDPASNIINMVLPPSLEGALTIFDMTGREMMNGYLAKKNNIVLDISSYADGVYIVRLTTSKGSSMKKFIKE